MVEDNMKTNEVGQKYILISSVCLCNSLPLICANENMHIKSQLIINIVR